jgi:hypothetical protein
MIFSLRYRNHFSIETIRDNQNYALRQAMTIRKLNTFGIANKELPNANTDDEARSRRLFGANKTIS